MSVLYRIDPNSPNARELIEVRRRLTPQQALFLDEYCVDMDEQRAARAAGYTRNGKGVLKQFYVARALQLVMAERRHRLRVDQDRIVEEYAKIGFSNMGDYLKPGSDGLPQFDYSGLDRDQTAAISEITIEEFMEGRGDEARPGRRTKFKLHDKKSALDSLSRYLGLFVDRVELRGKMETRLLNMSREERLGLMEELLEGARKFLPLSGNVVDIDYQEIGEGDG